MPKPLLVGLDYPYNLDPRYALWPLPENSAGNRLWKMTGMSMATYTTTFDRVNLDSALIDSSSTQRFRDASVIVLLGEEVRQHFGVPKRLIHPVLWELRSDYAYPIKTVHKVFRQIPHPSGRTRFYNDPVQRHLVSMMLRELAGATPI